MALRQRHWFAHSQMPHFKSGTVEYSMAIGMHENPFTLDSRARPPYTKCKCGAAD